MPTISPGGVRFPKILGPELTTETKGRSAHA
jgi:hypothetical protein